MTLTAVLLAGGQSRRMCKEKATIVFRGEALWQRQLETLKNLYPEKIFISSRIKPEWMPIGAESLLDEPPSHGPLSGLTRALDRMQTSHLVVLAVDMPFMTGDEMRLLRDFAREGCGVVPMIDQRAEPLAAIYPREALSDFVAALASREFSLQTLVRTLAQSKKVQLFDVPKEKRNLYRSVNEPADLSKEN